MNKTKKLNLKGKSIFEILHLNICTEKMSIVGSYYNTPHTNTKQQKQKEIDRVFRKYCSIM